MSSPDISDKQFQFRLADILVSNFGIMATPVIGIDSNIASMEFGYNFTFEIPQEIAICKVNFKYSVATDLKDLSKGQTQVLNVEINYIFRVVELEKYVRVRNEKKHLETGVLLNLLSIAYSTSRGIIYERTRGYGINGLHLAVANLEDLIKDVKINNDTAAIDPTASPQPS